MSSTDVEQLDMELVATRVMYELLGRRWVWPALQVVDVYPTTSTIFLSGRPVQEIISVTDAAGVELAPEDYTLYGAFRLQLPRKYDRTARVCGTNEITVEYVYGSPPPAQVALAIHTLATELEKLIAGDTNCKLPQRITSISRQGISMALIDPQEFLDQGRTGLPSVDAALMTFNRANAKSRARLFTRENPPAKRLSAVPVP